jgi:hypothetical protein
MFGGSLSSRVPTGGLSDWSFSRTLGMRFCPNREPKVNLNQLAALFVAHRQVSLSATPDMRTAPETGRFYVKIPFAAKQLQDQVRELVQ